MIHQLDVLCHCGAPLCVDDFATTRIRIVSKHDDFVTKDLVNYSFFTDMAS